MPITSYFAGFSPPSDAAKWNHAQWQASTGEQVLLAQMLKVIKGPFDFIQADPKFKWVQRLTDAQVDANTGFFNKLAYNTFPPSPIVMLGHRQFVEQNFEGADSGWETMHPSDIIEKMRREGRIRIPRRFVGIGLMDENWGWLSSYFLNRTALWKTHFTSENNFKYFGANFTEDEIGGFLDDSRLIMLLVNQHHNISAHPKVLSLPLGVGDARMVWTTLSRAVRKKETKNTLIHTAGSDW